MKRCLLVSTIIGLTACTSAPPPVVTAQGNFTDARFSSLVTYLQGQMERYEIPERRSPLWKMGS